MYFSTFAKSSCKSNQIKSLTGLNTGGAWFEDAAEKLQLLEVLRLTQRENAWSNDVNEETLRRSWNLPHG
jgi:hypothetical protein